MVSFCLLLQGPSNDFRVTKVEKLDHRIEWLKIPAAPERKRNKITKSPFYFFMMEKWKESGNL